jgi:hypothetical protein
MAYLRQHVPRSDAVWSSGNVGGAVRDLDHDDEDRDGRASPGLCSTRKIGRIWLTSGDSVIGPCRSGAGRLECGEVGTGLFDGFGVCALLLLLGECPLDAGEARVPAFVLAGGDDQVGADVLDGLAVRAAAEHGVQHVVGDLPGYMAWCQVAEGRG